MKTCPRKLFRTQATIKKRKSLILKVNPPSQRFIVSKLGMSTGTNILEPILEEEIPALCGKDIDKVDIEASYGHSF
ncbi:hypothetical protein TNCV_4745031 [Trichonephila clavipes]|nr:hypothetical protein TNCV_4745031 [Trichonephila clavipes]